MSFQVGPVCYPTRLAATYAIGSAQAGTVVQLGTTVYTVHFKPELSSDNQAVYVLIPFKDGQPSLTRSVLINHVPCGLIDTPDALTLGWLIAVVWLIAAAIKTLNRGIHE